MKHMKLVFRFHINLFPLFITTTSATVICFTLLRMKTVSCKHFTLHKYNSLFKCHQNWS